MSNRLIHEPSPYLRQHAHNPVDWYPWGDEARERAAAENKILIISIGYSSCHWCHVMERETFEDQDAAALMNESFISIKVDREERPDIDAHYMNALQLITGQGGWPLNIFALPDGRAFYGGTYFPRDRWISLLTALRDQHRTDPGRLVEYALRIAEGIGDFKKNLLEPSLNVLETRSLEKAVEEGRRLFDLKRGGAKGAPKFPMPVWLRFLMAWSRLKGDGEARDFVLLTLDRMAGGGIYDQLGGGFSRYSVDPDWKLPHFEKMLYDNAQLISLYADAWKWTGKRRYARIVEQSMAFVGEFMTSPEGFFYSALDADSEGEEGRYYLWREEELKQILKEDFDFAARQYCIGEEGLLEKGQNILLLPQAPSEGSQDERTLEKIRRLLKGHRSKRSTPGLDDKALISWNALMIKACADAYDALGRKEYLRAGRRAADLILRECRKDDGTLYHAWREGRPYIDGFFEDYAYMAGALISLFQSSGQTVYLEEAVKLTDKSIELFYDPDHSVFFQHLRRRRLSAEGSGAEGQRPSFTQRSGGSQSLPSLPSDGEEPLRRSG